MFVVASGSAQRSLVEIVTAVSFVKSDALLFFT